MSDSPPSLTPAPENPLVEKKTGCRRPFLTGCGILVVLGLLGLSAPMWVIIPMTRRADRFHAHVKVGQTVTEVFAGPGEWDWLHVTCRTSGGNSTRVNVRGNRDDYSAQSWQGGPVTRYPNLDALVREMAAGTGLFAGRVAFAVEYIALANRRRTYELTLGPDDKVVKIERVSRQ